MAKSRSSGNPTPDSRMQNSTRNDSCLKRFSPIHAESHLPEAVCQNKVFEDGNAQPITEMVMQSCVPLVRVRESSVEISQFHSESKDVPFFVAISHVRSQGLGNTKQNALPMCQLSRLQNLVNGLHPAYHQPAYFWIDTVCIPHAQPGKSMAFELLEVAYRRASVVLALDYSIQRTPTASGCDELMAIKKSTWYKRLWTIREGALAPSLRFQFKDGSVSFDDLLEQSTTNSLNHAADLSPTSAGMDELHCTQETRAGEEPLLDALWLFERDQRVYLGRAPGTVRDPSRGAQKDLLRSLLFKGYRSTSRYQLFLTPPERAGLAVLRQAIEKVYNGLTYKGLLAEQALSIAGTIERINIFISL